MGESEGNDPEFDNPRSAITRKYLRKSADNGRDAHSYQEPIKAVSHSLRHDTLA